MRSTLIVVGGLFLLLFFVVVSGYAGGTSNTAMARGALWYLLLWLIVAGVNMWLGLVRDQRPMDQELTTFAIVFSIPAVVALFVWWRLSRG